MKTAEKNYPEVVVAIHDEFNTAGFSDPVVLQPVTGGNLIICAWGPEASDPLIVNERDN